MPDDPQLFAQLLMELEPNNSWNWVAPPTAPIGRVERGVAPPSSQYPQSPYSEKPLDDQLFQRKLRGLIPIGGLGI
jgi:hypothetical protein